SDGRVGLLGLNTDLLEDNSLGVRGTTEWRGLEVGSEKPLLVSVVGPAAVKKRILSALCSCTDPFHHVLVLRFPPLPPTLPASNPNQFLMPPSRFDAGA